MATAKRIIIAVAVALLSSAAMSEQFLWSRPFATADEAAASALFEAVYMADQHDPPIEFCGLIYEFRGRFYFTVPRSSGHAHSVLVNVPWPRAARLAGIYHNHPPGRGNEEFSSIDVRQAIELGVPTYISIADEGHQVRKWDPSDRGSLHYRFGLGNPQTRGELVSATVVDVLALADQSRDRTVR